MVRGQVVVGLVLALFLAGQVWAETSAIVRPEDVGFSATRLAYIDKFYADKVDKGEMAGIVTLVARHGKIAHFSAIGYADLGVRRKIKTDTIFRLYSMTKPIAATALMMLYEEGAFQLDDPISKYLPEFSHLKVLRTPESSPDDTVPMQREPTIHDLFRHTAGFAVVGEDYTKSDLFGLNVSLAEMMKRLARLPLRYQPGTKWVYSIGQDVQARLVEIFSAMPFDEFLEKRLFAPLGMKDSGFWVKADKASRLAAVHWSKDGKLVPFDEAHGYPKSKPTDFLLQASNINSYASNNAHKGGSYGLLGTAEDYWRFAQMMLNGGEFEGVRFLSPRTVRYMTRDHLGSVSILNDNGGPSGIGWGLGFAVLNDPVAAGLVGSEGSFYWAGAAATTFWIDPKEDVVVVVMTQHLQAPLVDWQTLRSQMSAMVYGALIH
jgi:CubicO group peptidase (beta-lactamase class C family)